MIFALLRFLGVVWIVGFIAFAVAATSAYLFSSADPESRTQRWTARLTTALIWPIALMSAAGRTRLLRGF
jgi:hypothetical protein